MTSQLAGVRLFFKRTNRMYTQTVIQHRTTTTPSSVSDTNHNGASVFADRRPARQHELRINLSARDRLLARVPVYR